MERGRLKLISRWTGTAVLAGVLGMSVFGSSLAPASSGQRAPKPYTLYVACGMGANAKPAHSCAKGSKKAAFFRSNLADVHYKICVRFPTGQRLCAPHQPAAAGTLH